MRPTILHLEPPVADVVACALRQAIDDLERLVESALDLVAQQLLDPHHALTAIHELTTTDLDPRTDATCDDSTTVTTSDADATCTEPTPTEHRTTSHPTPPAAHRLAPGCQPAPSGHTGPGARRC